MTKEEKRILLTLTFIYTLVILYFLFIGFNRLGNLSTIGYRFNLKPSIFSGNYHNLFSPSLFNLGNLIAFVPFGIFIPFLWKTNYFKFVASFILLISLVEAIQMLTYLGSADIDDVILNSLGVSIGYFSFYVSTKLNTSVRRQLIFAGLIALLVLGIFLVL